MGPEPGALQGERQRMTKERIKGEKRRGMEDNRGGRGGGNTTGKEEEEEEEDEAEDERKE